MTITETIEYTDAKGNDCFFDVELFGELEEINDTFTHEFGTEYFEPYQQLKDYPEWNQLVHSLEENFLIAIHVVTKFHSIEKLFIEHESSFIDEFINE